MQFIELHKVRVTEEVLIEYPPCVDGILSSQEDRGGEDKSLVLL